MANEIEYEVWRDETSVTCTTAAGIDSLREKNLISSDAKLLTKITASTYEEAMGKYHEFMGWAPYRPVGPCLPCPNSCGASYYPENSSQCPNCGEISSRTDGPPQRGAVGPPYRLRFFFDPGSGVAFWSANQAARERFGYAVDESDLPLSLETRGELMRLCQWFDEGFNFASPLDPGPFEQDECVRFNAAVEQALGACKRELGVDFEIVDEFKRLKEDPNLRPYVRDALTTLAPLLGDSSDRVRRLAARFLGMTGDPHALQPLREQLMMETDYRVAESIVLAIRRLDESNAYEILAPWTMSDEGPSLLYLRAKVLGNLGDPRAVPFLVREVQRPTIEDHSVSAICEALGKLRASDAVDVLMRVLSEGHSSAADAAKALGLVGDPRAIPALVQGFVCGGGITIQCIFALVRFGEEALPSLFAATRDKNEKKRRWAACTLGKIGGPDAISVLQSLLDDPVPEVREQVAMALHKARSKVSPP